MPFSFGLCFRQAFVSSQVFSGHRVSSRCRAGTLPAFVFIVHELCPFREISLSVHRNDGNWIGVIPLAEFFRLDQLSDFGSGVNQLSGSAFLRLHWKPLKNLQVLPKKWTKFLDFFMIFHVKIGSTSKNSQQFFCGSLGLLSAVLVGFISTKGSQL